jgi:creatinine amidohydrolase
LRSGYWQDLTTTDLVGVDPEQVVALLPVSAVEQHGPHLPLGTDAIINDGIVRAALERLPADGPALLVLPALTVGHSLEHGSFPGTLSAPAGSVMELWLEVGRGAARAGLRKLILLNTHGGQKALVDLVAVKLRAELGLLVVRANYFAFGLPPDLFDPAELAHDLHGGALETSLLLHLRPELVRKEQCREFGGLAGQLAARHSMLGVERPVGIGWLSEDLNPAGASGQAGVADAERGAAYLTFLAERLAALVGEVASTPLAILK